MYAYSTPAIPGARRPGQLGPLLWPLPVATPAPIELALEDEVDEHELAPLEVGSRRAAVNEGADEFSITRDAHQRALRNVKARKSRRTK